MARLALLLSVLSFAVTSFAFDYTVIAGRDQVTGLLGTGFAPSRTVTRDNGDRVVFRMNSGSHRIVETTFNAPCTPRGTFDTGLVAVPNGTVGATAGPSFPFPIANASSFHYFADIAPIANSSGTQCQQGAVFCVNTDETSSTTSCVAFRNAALALGAQAGVTTSSRPPFTSSTSTSSTPSSTRVSTASSASASSSRPASAAGKAAVGGGGVLAAVLGLFALL